VQLSTADNVKTAAGFGQNFQNIYVAAGLNGIANGWYKSAIGLFNFLQMVLEGGLAVDIDRCAELSGYSFNIYVFSEQFTVFVIKIIHIVILSSSEITKICCKQYKKSEPNCKKTVSGM